MNQGEYAADWIGGLIQSILGNELAALDGLEEGVVKISRHACAFRQSLLEAGADGLGNLTYAVKVCGKNEDKKQGGRNCPEPPCAPPGRQDFDKELRAWLAPLATACCTLHAKSVNACRQSGVRGDPLIASHLIPLLIQSLQHVAISVCGSIEIAQGGKFDRENLLLVSKCNCICVVDGLSQR